MVAFARRAAKRIVGMADARHVPHPGELLRLGLQAERSGQLDRALAYYRAAGEATGDALFRSEALRRQSDVFRQRSDWGSALDAVRRSGDVALRAGLIENFAEAMNAEGAVHLVRGHPTDAVPQFERVLRRRASLRVRAAALQNLGCAAAMGLDFDAARGYFHDAHRAFDRADDAHGAAAVVLNDGAAAIDQGDMELAEHLCGRAVQAARRANDLTYAATAAKNYAEALIAQSKLLHRAEAPLIAAFGFFRGAGDVQGQIPCLRLLGDLYVARSEPANAVRPYGRALRLARRIGLPREATLLEKRLHALGYGMPKPPSPLTPPPNGSTEY